MDSEYIQFVRYKLQKRLKRLNCANFQGFHFTLIQVWGFLQENEITKGILDDLERRFQNCEQDANKTLLGQPQVGTTESENDAICYWVVKKCATDEKADIEIQVGQWLTHESKYDACIEGFRLTYVEPLFDYIDEQIDDKRMILVLLKKFKHRCEWFYRSEMFERFKDDTGKGESILATSLYQYLFDQGVQFHIEPQSASGRVDLISAQSGKDRFVADAKLFNPDRGQDRGYIVKGFRQVYEYTKDFNEPFGYLVIFKTSARDLAIPTEHQESTIPFITHNNKTVFIVVVDIFDYPESASKRGKLEAYEITPSQSLGALLKSARDIMRKDKGLNGDLDRLPMLTWIMFLKFLDDLELQREGEAKLAGKKSKPAVEPPYRWRDWAAKSDGITGDELIAFINNEETTLPNSLRRATSGRGPGLFRYLRTLTSSNGDNRRDVIATVFRGVQNRMVSGYLLRDVINKLNGIHFTASDELHTLGALYESMLREMRDAAGDSGEFYTPRAVVRLMVAVTDPCLGETVLDPASGTGGFLVEAYNHLAKQVKTVADRKVLQERSLFGCEPKSLPYLLCQMNLLLHGLDAPQIDPGNSLRFKLTDIGERDRVDVILTNPPFGGEEEKGIQGNFPEDKQTGETALLFLQLIMRKLRKVGSSVCQSDQGRGGTRPYQWARAAVVVPNGTLFGDGVCARIKEELLKEFNLHTIVRLPNGVFAPYTGIPTNILFFDRSGPTREVWYYEQPLPEGRKNYTKTAPIQFEDFAPLVAWWDQPGPGNKREENERAWKVPAAELLANGCNLDRKNPRAKEDITHLPPAQLAADILKKEHRIAEIMGRIQGLLKGQD